MAIVLTVNRGPVNTLLGKEAIVTVTSSAATDYITGGVVLDFTATGLGSDNGFNTIASVSVDELYSSAATPAALANTLCTRARYLPAASHAVATGRLYMELEDGTSGVTAQLANAADISTVIARLHIKGS